MQNRFNIVAMVVTALLLASLGGCTSGSPLHFKSKGDVWAIPVVGVDNVGAPVVGVKIQGKGPFPFSVRFGDTSTIHPGLAKELGLWETVNRSSGIIGDKSGDTVASQITYAQVDSMSFGELAIGGFELVMLPYRATVDGVPVLGVIGADILSDTTIWHLDWDAKELIVANQKHFEPRPGSRRVGLTINNGELFTNVTTQNGREVYMRVLFDGPSTIRPDVAKKAGLIVGVDGRFIATDLSVGEAHADQLAFGPYREDRRIQNPIEGELGARFWNRFNVTVNLHEKAIWLTPRAAAPAAP